MNYLSLSKEQIVKTIIKEIPSEINPFLHKNIDRLIFDWWFTANGSGLRLTELGHKAFSMANIEYFEFQLGPIKSWNIALLNLSKKINCPYFISAYKIIKIYDSKIAVLITLHGDVFSYVDSIR